jgi:hypothetical protein
MLAFDPYSGDYGSGFWGFAANTATYITHDPALGWLCFGGNLSPRSNSVRVIPLDASRSRLYIAPAGLWITLDAGRIREVNFDSTSGEVRLTLDPATSDTPQAIVRISQPAALDGVGAYQPVKPLRQERGAFIAPLHDKPLVIHLRPARFQPGRGK